MKLKMVGAIAAILTAAVSSSAWATNIVTNGSFSGCSGFTCTGWTFTPAASGSSLHYSDPFCPETVDSI